MADPSWPHAESPFHAGELAIQARLGFEAQIDRQGRRIIRDYLPVQHQQFFAQLPYVMVGTVDAAGNPWASILVGQPGFLTSPNDRTLQINAQTLFGDPLATTLSEGCDIGLLGIELHTRRRNRINGTITAIHDHGFEVQVGQSFGNCPQYIQSRMFTLDDFNPNIPKPVSTIATFSEFECAMIRAADTFFISTANQTASAGAARGVDVAHRGGKPGFIRIDNDRTLTIPDFSGNHHFNTFGNLEVNPCAGLLFIDFDRGDVLYLTGTAQVIWEGDEITIYEGAERLFRFYLEQGYRVEGSLPLKWSSPEFSPFLSHTGTWSAKEM
jgi:uncharacterized protein